MKSRIMRWCGTRRPCRSLGWPCIPTAGRICLRFATKFVDEKSAVDFMGFAAKAIEKGAGHLGFRVKAVADAQEKHEPVDDSQVEYILWLLEHMNELPPLEDPHFGVRSGRPVIHSMQYRRSVEFGKEQAATAGDAMAKVRRKEWADWIHGLGRANAERLIMHPSVDSKLPKVHAMKAEYDFSNAVRGRFHNQVELWHHDKPPRMNAYMEEQLITCIGNKRKLLDSIGMGLTHVRNKLGKERLVAADLFSGSGVVSRYMKRYHAGVLHANDIEPYAEAVSQCFLLRPGRRG